MQSLYTNFITIHKTDFLTYRREIMRNSFNKSAFIAFVFKNARNESPAFDTGSTQNKTKKKYRRFTVSPEWNIHYIKTERNCQRVRNSKAHFRKKLISHSNNRICSRYALTYARLTTRYEETYHTPTITIHVIR